MKRDHGPLVDSTASFHITRWTIVIRAAQNQTREGQSALAELCRIYWYSLYMFGLDFAASTFLAGLDFFAIGDVVSEFF